MTKNRGACALTRAGRSLYTIKFKSARREPDLSILGLDPVSLSKIETHLLASLGNKGKNSNSLTCLRNAGFYSAVTYCIRPDRSAGGRSSTSRRCNAKRALSSVLDTGGGERMSRLVEKGRLQKVEPKGFA